MPVRQKQKAPIRGNEVRRESLRSQSRWRAWRMKPVTATVWVKDKTGSTVRLPNGSAAGKRTNATALSSAP